VGSIVLKSEVKILSERVTLHLDFKLADLLLIAQLARAERMSVEQFIQRCIQFYIDEKYNKPREPRQEDVKK